MEALIAQVSDNGLELGGLFNNIKVNVDEYKNLINEFKNFESINDYIGIDNIVDWDNLSKAIGITDTRLRSYLETLDDGKGNIDNASASTEGMAAYLKKSGQMFDFAAIKATLLNTALNAGIMLAVSIALQAVVKGLDNFINRAKYAKEAMEEAQSAIDSEQNKLKSMSDMLSNNRERFLELSQSVDKFSKNLSLSEEDYAEYLSISNQLAELSPSLVSGYDEQGNALLAIGSNVDETNEKLQSLLETQQAIAQQTLIENMDAVANGIYFEVKDTKNSISNLESQLSDLQQQYKEINIDIVNSDGLFSFDEESYSKYGKILEDAFASAGVEFEKVIGLYDTGIQLISASPEQLDWAQKFYDAQIESENEYYHASENGLKQDIDAKEKTIETSYAKMNANLQAWMKDNYNYQYLSDNASAMADALLPEIKWDELDEPPMTAFDYQNYIEKNIIEPLMEVPLEHKNEVDNMFQKLLSFEDGDLDVLQFAEQLQEKLNEWNIKIDITPIIADEKDEKRRLQNSIESIAHGSDYYTSSGNHVDAEDHKRLQEYTEGFTTAQVELWLEATRGAENATQAIDMYKAALAEAKESAKEPTTLSISQTIDQLNTQLKPAFDSLKSAYQDLFTDDGFTPDKVDIPMLESIKSSIEEINKLEDVDIDIRAFDKFATTLTDVNTTEEQAKQAFNDFATEIYNASTATDGMTEETVQMVEQLLDSLGVVNAEEVALNALSEATARAITNSYDLANATEEDIAAMLSEAQAAGITNAEIFKLVTAEQVFDQQGLNPKEKIERLKELAEAYGQTAIATRIANMEIGAEKGHTSINYEDELASLQNQINNTINNVQIDFSGVTKSAGSAGKSAGDAYVDAFEKELKELDDLRDRGVTDETEYLHRLRELYTRYFADRKEYLDEFRKYERQYLEGMKSLYDSALSGISKLMDSKIDSYTESKEAAIESLEAEQQAAEEAYQSQIDAIDNMIAKKQEIIDSVQDEIDAMKEAREERQRQLDLQKAQYELERMQNQRTMLVYSEDKGMHYRTDESGIRDAKEAVDDAKFEIEIAAKEKEINLLEDEIDLLEKQKDALEEAKEASNKYYETLINQQEQYWDSMIKSMEQQKSKWEELAEIEEIADAYSKVYQVFNDLGYSVEDVLNGSDAAFEDFKSRYISILSEMNQNTSFQEGLEYASGAAKESFGSIVADAKDSIQQLSQAFSDGTFSNAIATGISEGMVSAKQELDKMNQLGSDAGEGFIEGWNEKSSEVSDATKQTAKDAVDAFAEGQDSHSPSVKYQELAGDAIAGLLLGVEENKQSFIDTVKSLAEEGVLTFEEGFNFENSSLNTSFDALKLLIESVTEALGIGTDGTVGGLLGALTQLSDFSFSEDSIIKQFDNLKTAIDEVTSAISGGGVSSDGEGQGGGSGSAKGGKSGGKGSKNGSNGNSLKSAITDIGTTASTVIGQPEAEGDGTVIGEFGSLETAVSDVTAAIGSADSKGDKNEGENTKGGDNLIDSIIDLGDTTEETLGESGGDGVTGRFEGFRDVIGEAKEHVTGISDGLAAIDGQEVECTIKIHVESDGFPAYASGTALEATDLDSKEYTAKYEGNTHVAGTANVTGNWGVRKPGRSLVGELGQEIWVHSANGTFETVGDNGAEFINTKKGDLIFNHLQTKELLSKGNIVKKGRAYANGNVQYSDGSVLRPLQEGDRGWDLMKAFEPLAAKIQKGEEVFSNAMFEHQKQMEKWTKEITNNTAINNISNNRNVQPVVNHISITCPGVTEQQVAERLGSVIGMELDKQFSGFHNYTDQMSRIR